MTSKKKIASTNSIYSYFYSTQFDWALLKYIIGHLQINHIAMTGKSQSCRYI